MRNEITTLITGDTYLGGGRVRKLAEENDADKLFGDFLQLMKDSDLSITNLESPIIDQGLSIDKTGPALKSSVNSAQILNTAGIDLVTLANNHIMDYGDEGLRSTLETCKALGINYTGAGENYDKASEPYIFEKNGIKIAVLNVAENEFGTTNGTHPGCHPLNPVQNFYSINDVREEVDHTIMIVHGGHEYYNLPSPRMKQTYRYFIDAGASAVIGHHTHCFSGHEIYNGKPICYSLGNFLFDNEKLNSSNIKPWHQGLICELKISKSNIETRYLPYVQNFKNEGIRNMVSEEHEHFSGKISELNNTINDDAILQARFKNYCKISKRLYSSYLEPHSNRLLHALRNRGFFPSLLSKRKKLLLLNLTRCESHRDVLIEILDT